MFKTLALFPEAGLTAGHLLGLCGVRCGATDLFTAARGGWGLLPVITQIKGLEGWGLKIKPGVQNKH